MPDGFIIAEVKDGGALSVQWVIGGILVASIAWVVFEVVRWWRVRQRMAFRLCRSRPLLSGLISR